MMRVTAILLVLILSACGAAQAASDDATPKPAPKAFKHPILDRLQFAPDARAKVRAAYEEYRKKTQETVTWCMGEYKKGKKPLKDCLAKHRKNRIQFHDALMEELTETQKKLYENAEKLISETQKKARPLYAKFRKAEKPEDKAKIKEDLAAMTEDLKKKLDQMFAAPGTKKGEGGATEGGKMPAPPSDD